MINKMNKKGFTLIEMLIVVVIIGVLSSIVLPRITGNAKEAKIKACLQQVASINSTIELIMFEKSLVAPTGVDFPAVTVKTAAVDTIAGGIMDEYFPDGGMSCPVASNQYHIVNGRVDVSDLANDGHVSDIASGHTY